MPQNATHMKAIMTAVELGYETQVKYDEYFEMMSKKIKNSLNKLAYDKRNNSVNIYGIQISMALLQSIGVGLSTILGFAA
jgi:hypothetical protein